MKKLWVFIFILLTLASTSHAQHKIFDCILSEDLDCIKFESQIDQSWASKKNRDKNTPLELAIKMKSPKLVAYLISLGAKVSFDHVSLAMYYFFDVPNYLLTLDDTSINKLDVKLLDDLILAATKTKPAEKSIFALTRILDLFYNKDLIALRIKYLRHHNKITQRDINLFGHWLPELFLQDTILTKQQLIIIITALKDLKINHNILLLIVETYDSHLIKLDAIPHYDIGSLIEPSMIDNFTQAIIYFSQNFLSLVPPSAIIRHVFLGEKNAIISQSIDFSVQLSRFVECSINAVSVPQERRSRYEFWSQILDNLLSQGDFNYAFSIAAALNSNAMESIMPKKIHEDIAIACPLANFKNYRFMLSASSNNFHIPSLMITIHDLSMLKDTEFFLGDKLNLSFIASLSDMRESMSAAYKKMQERDYRPSEAMIKFFGDMPQSKEECWYFSPGAFKERMQKNGRRNLSFKSISGFPAAAATVFDSPRKLKEHEQAKYAYKKAEIF